MHLGHQLEFLCIECKEPLFFSALDSEVTGSPIKCENCKKAYAFDDATIMKDLRDFEALCQQIHESRGILGNTHIAVKVEDKEVKIPFKLLLTRLSSTMDLDIGGKKVSIKFRLEPSKELALA
jgi:DNA-directed RNA polymerase subunit RPC12/RpoP